MYNRRPAPRSRVDRAPPTRVSYDRVLIVAEGEQTEPIYFDGLANHYRLTTADITVVGMGSDPSRVVKEAQEAQAREKALGDGYDNVYCVFDRDSHTNFSSASALAIESGFRLARSWPCFEYWLLLHFLFSRKPYARSGNRSPCDNCIRDLRKHVAHYEKASLGIFEELVSRLDLAKKHAAQAMAEVDSDEDRNPSTEVHELVEYLQHLKRPGLVSSSALVHNRAKRHARPSPRS